MDTTEARINLATLYSRHGTAAEEDEQLTLAAKYYQNAIEIYQTITTKQYTDQIRQALATMYCRLGAIAEERKKYSRALSYYMETLKLRRFLADQTSTVEAKHDLAQTCYIIYQLHKRLGSKKYRYIHYLEEAHDIWKELTRQHPRNYTFAQHRDITKQLLDALL